MSTTADTVTIEIMIAWVAESLADSATFDVEDCTVSIRRGAVNVNGAQQIVVQTHQGTSVLFSKVASAHLALPVVLAAMNEALRVTVAALQLTATTN